jgi:hypothetical protein
VARAALLEAGLFPSALVVEELCGRWWREAAWRTVERDPRAVRAMKSAAHDHR